MYPTYQPESQAICPDCEFGPFTRNNYFTGKLLVERDFKDETLFHMERLRHHQARLHGWGVVCGLEVTPHESPDCRNRFFYVQPGTAIDCCGHEIVVREPELVDFTLMNPLRGWLSSQDEEQHSFQICLRYRECPTEDIPVLYDDCGCDETQCAPNRILESFEVELMLAAQASPVLVRSPGLAYHSTAGPAHASRVALHGPRHRLYVIMADDQKMVFQLDAETFMVMGAHDLPGAGLDLAVSNDGDRLYVATAPVSGPKTNPRQLIVLDTADNLANSPIWTFDLPANSAGSEVFLAVAPAPNDRLIALLGTPGDILIWPMSLDQPGTGAAPAPKTGNMGSNLRGLVIGSDSGHAYTLDPANDRIEVIKISDMTQGTPITGVTNPWALALVASTAADMLAVVGQNPNMLYLVSLDGSGIVGSEPLDYAPIALTVSPGGQWAYVLERDGDTSYVQTVNLYRLRQGLSPEVGTPFKVGDGGQQIVISVTGERLVIPFTGDLEQPNRGGLTILEVSEQACDDILWRPCPDCDVANCLVLATVENYRAGDRLEEQTDPPTSEEAEAGIARIDNRRDRRLLPSTQALMEWIECLGQQGAGRPGPQGPPGADGQDGQPGADGAPGLGVDDAEVVKTLPAGSNAQADLVPRPDGTRWIELQIPKGDKGDPGPSGTGQSTTGLETIDIPGTVPAGTPYIYPPSGPGISHCLGNVPVGIMLAVVHEIVSGVVDYEEFQPVNWINEDEFHNLSFLSARVTFPHDGTFRIRIARDRRSENRTFIIRWVAVAGTPCPPPPVPIPGPAVEINAATTEELEGLPGIGPRLAARIVELRRDSPFASVEDLLIVPGVTERLLADIRPLVTIGEARVDLNRASRDELIAVPGITEELAERIVRLRKRPFTSLDNFRRRLRPSPQGLARMGDRITVVPPEE